MVFPVWACVFKSLQLCLTLCDPMDSSPPGSSVHGILQARILEWVAMPSSRGFSQPRDRMYRWESWTIKGWALKNWCIWIVVLEKTLENPWDNKEMQPVSPKGTQPWMLTGRTDTEAENSNTLATWCGHPNLWERPWRWERLKAKGEEGGRGWDGWITSLIQWTWTWTNSVR